MNGIMEIRRQVRLSQWSAIVREREESGLSVKAYCEQTGIAARTYYYRLRRLREAAVKQDRFEATQPELVQFTPPAEYAVGQAQRIVIKTADTSGERAAGCRSRRSFIFEAVMIDLSNIIVNDNNNFT